MSHLGLPSLQLLLLECGLVLLPLEGDLVCLPLECGLVLLHLLRPLHLLHPLHVPLVACLHLPHHGKHELIWRLRQVGHVLHTRRARRLRRVRLGLRWLRLRWLRHEAVDVDAVDLVEDVVGVHVGEDVPVPPDLGKDDGDGLEVGWALD